VRARGGQLYGLTDAQSHFDATEGVRGLRLPADYGELSPIAHVLPLQMPACAIMGPPFNVSTQAIIDCPSARTMKSQSAAQVDRIAQVRSDPAVAAFVREVRARLGGRVRQLRLFGSRARGDARHDSDYDMLVVVDRRTPELRAAIVDIEVGILDRYDALFASVVRDEDEWKQRRGSPLARNIAREGVRL
jgi:predicted nucleotidyltransferase